MWRNKRRGGHSNRRSTETTERGCPCCCALFHCTLLFLSFACPQQCNNSLCSQCHCDDRREQREEWGGWRNDHIHTQRIRTTWKLQRRRAYNCKQAGLNNEIRIKYKRDEGIVEPAVAQQTPTLTHGGEKVGYCMWLHVFYHYYDSYTLYYSVCDMWLYIDM